MGSVSGQLPLLWLITWSHVERSSQSRKPEGQDRVSPFVSVSGEYLVADGVMAEAAWPASLYWLILQELSSHKHDLQPFQRQCTRWPNGLSPGSSPETPRLPPSPRCRPSILHMAIHIFSLVFLPAIQCGPRAKLKWHETASPMFDSPKSISGLLKLWCGEKLHSLCFSWYFSRDGSCRSRPAL